MTATSERRREQCRAAQARYRARKLRDDLGYAERVRAYKRARRAAGLDRKVQQQAKEIRRAYTQQRQEALNLLKAGPCADCGHTFPPVAMDFDHVRGEKLYQISANTMMRADFLDELAKCELRCACCHRIRHQSDGTLGRPGSC